MGSAVHNEQTFYERREKERGKKRTKRKEEGRKRGARVRQQQQWCWRQHQRQAASNNNHVEQRGTGRRLWVCGSALSILEPASLQRPYRVPVVSALRCVLLLLLVTSRFLLLVNLEGTTRFSFSRKDTKLVPSLDLCACTSFPSHFLISSTLFGICILFFVGSLL